MMDPQDYAAERAALESSVASHREDLGAALAQISSATRETLSPARQAARRPYQWILVGLGVGVALAIRSTHD